MLGDVNTTRHSVGIEVTAVGRRKLRACKSMRDAVRPLLSDEKEHGITDLAHDIAELGSLDPSSRLIVTEKSEEPRMYGALEGSRPIKAARFHLIAAGPLSTPSWTTKHRHSQTGLACRRPHRFLPANAGAMSVL